MASADGRHHITFNGEIFNYRDLRGRLSLPLPHRRRHGGACWRCTSPAARQAVQELRGQFAYGLFDGEDLWLYRDRLGVLPLFYYRDADVFAFASEIKALLPALPGPPEVDQASLDSYLSPPGRARAVHPVPSHPEAAGRPPAPVRTRRHHRPDPLLGAPHRHPSPHGRGRGRGARVDRSARRGRAGPGGRRPGRLTAQRRRRQQPDRGPGHRGPGRPHRDLLGRLRRPPLRRARPTPARSAASSAPTTTRSSFDPTSSRARWRQLTWHRDAPLSEPADIAVYELADAGPQIGEGAPVGRGQRRALRRLPQVPGGAPRPTGRPGARPACGPAPWAGPSAQAPARAGRARIALRTMVGARPSWTASRSWFAPFTAPERRPPAAGRRVPSGRRRPSWPATMPSSGCWPSTAPAGWPTTCSSEVIAWPWPRRWSCDRRSSTTSWWPWPSHCRRA